jgi:hypothetical protein
VGQDEDPQAFVRRADLCRREQARRRRVAQSPKLSQDGLEPEGDVPGDVFEEDPFGLAFTDDTGDVGPEVPLVVGSLALSCHAERLTGVSGEYGVDCASEGPAVKGGDIIPDRGWREVSGPLGGNEGLAWVFFPLDKASRVEAGFGQHEAHIEATGPCAEGETVSGR